MLTLVLTIFIVGLLFAGMAVGLLAKKSLKGSCGGPDRCDCLKSKLTGKTCKKENNSDPTEHS